MPALCSVTAGSYVFRFRNAFSVNSLEIGHILPGVMAFACEKERKKWCDGGKSACP